MADITKCPGVYLTASGYADCPYAKACYRYTAKPSTWQSYMPYGVYSSTSPIYCRDFWFDKNVEKTNEAVLAIFARYISLIIMGNASQRDMMTLRLQVSKA